MTQQSPARPPEEFPVSVLHPGSFLIGSVAQPLFCALDTPRTRKLPILSANLGSNLSDDENRGDCDKELPRSRTDSLLRDSHIIISPHSDNRLQPRKSSEIHQPKEQNSNPKKQGRKPTSSAIPAIPLMPISASMFSPFSKSPKRPKDLKNNGFSLCPPSAFVSEAAPHSRRIVDQPWPELSRRVGLFLADGTRGCPAFTFPSFEPRRHESSVLPSSTLNS